MDYLENIRKIGQKCLEAVPVIVLGSGASAQYGLRGMGGLQQHLLKDVKPVGEKDEQDWDIFKGVLEETKDLEVTLQRVPLGESLLNQIIKQTRSMVLADDQEAFSRMVTGEFSLSLARLFRHLFNSTVLKVSVVTTNYDRLAEYATDSAGFQYHTGFSHGYYRSFAQEPTPSRKHRKSRPVEVWKVHGSVDWFHDDKNLARALPDSFEVPDTFMPLLVTPGLSKYQMTHQEPFRTIITNADRALAGAASYLCVGYGFNDTHIQPKLVERVLRNGVPVVILARTLTDSARTFLADCKNTDYLALERREDSSVAYFPEEPNGVDIPNTSLWEFDGFLNETIA